MPVTQGAEPTHKIDPESEKFLEFVRQELMSNSALKRIIEEVIFKAKVQLSQNPITTRKHLRDKLIKGAHEHGAPIYDDYRLKREFEDECLDLIGWTMVEKWNNLKKKPVNDPVDFF